MRLLFLLWITVWLSPGDLQAQARKGIAFLVGDWVGEGGGAPGQGTGEFSFHYELNGKTLVRRNVANYPATAGKPASKHEDLMVIYSERPGRPLEAIYFDNEGQVIRYDVEIGPDGNAIRFISRVQPDSPRFRLTYFRASDRTIDGEFEIAPPGKPEAFAPYLKWTARRKSAPIK
jgi:hypothetical protein